MAVVVGVGGKYSLNGKQKKNNNKEIKEMINNVEHAVLL